jgi:hypothetical protein
VRLAAASERLTAATVCDHVHLSTDKRQFGKQESKQVLYISLEDLLGNSGGALVAAAVWPHVEAKGVHVRHQRLELLHQHR